MPDYTEYDWLVGHGLPNYTDYYIDGIFSSLSDAAAAAADEVVHYFEVGMIPANNVKNDPMSPEWWTNQEWDATDLARNTDHICYVQWSDTGTVCGYVSITPILRGSKHHQQIVEAIDHDQW